VYGWDLRGTQMAVVTLVGPLKTAAGTAGPLHIDAHNVRALIAELARRFPELAPLLELGCAVAIDGTIYQDAVLVPIQGDSEVHVLPPIAGG
jgi:molybdopterin converting factor small subunit